MILIRVKPVDAKYVKGYAKKITNNTWLVLNNSFLIEIAKIAKKEGIVFEIIETKNPYFLE